MRTHAFITSSRSQWLLLLPALLAVLATAEGFCASAAFPVLTQLAHVRRGAQTNDTQAHSIRLEGTVLWADADAGRLVLRDSTGAEELELYWGGTEVMAGQRVRLAGTGMVGAQGSAIRVGTHGPVVNNDGVHGVVEKTGVVYLPAGLQPIRVEWFNAVARAALDVEYSGPETPRQRIPATALWREQADGDGNRRRINGLHYRIVPVVDEALPDFARVTSYQTGVCADFDPALIAGAEHQGVQFTGLLEVPRAGVYTFHLRSDDGSRLFVGRPTLQLDILGNGELPAPVPLVIGQSLRTNEHRLWATVEGTVLFAAPAGAGLRLELGAGLARLRVEIAEADGLSAADLLHRKMRLTGFCQAAQTLDGQHTPGVLLTPGRAQMELLAEPDEPAITATAGSNALPVLRTAAQVHRLKREEAQRG